MDTLRKWYENKEDFEFIEEKKKALKEDEKQEKNESTNKN